MSHPLVSRSPDLQRLVADGYEISISALGYLLVFNVPYVNSRKEVLRGTLVSSLVLAGDRTQRPDTHVALFVGEQPCSQDGSQISGIVHGSTNTQVDTNLQARLSFSNKPSGGYADYYEKMTRYIRILSDPAKSIDRNVTAQTYKVIEHSDDSPFVYMDTASARVGIGGTVSKLRELKIAIVGVGGTGSYVLDLVSKCPVHEIHLFDADTFVHHNAFRSPGAASVEELRTENVKKVDRFAQIYGRMHRGVVPHPERIDEQNISMLKNMDFVFICVDKA